MLADVGDRCVKQQIGAVEIEYREGSRNRPALAFLGQLHSEVELQGDVSITLPATEVAKTRYVGVYSPPVTADTDANGEAREGQAERRSSSAALWNEIANNLSTSGEILEALTVRPKVNSSEQFNESVNEPMTDLQRALAAMWAKLLNVSQVDIHDNFLDLGGHSVIAMQVLARIQEAFQIEIPFDFFFGTSLTVFELAKRIEGARVVDEDSIARLACTV
jgi:acyl carrier protein